MQGKQAMVFPMDIWNENTVYLNQFSTRTYMSDTSLYVVYIPYIPFASNYRLLLHKRFWKRMKRKQIAVARILLK